MSSSFFDLREPEFRRIEAILSKMRLELRTQAILLTSRSGQPIVTMETAGDIDYTALASLAAADLSAANGLARAIGEESFPILMHQGRKRSLFISDLLQRFLLVLVFDAAAPMGLVRYKCKQTLLLLEAVLRDRPRKTEKEESSDSPFNFTDEEIKALLDE